jgi:hypothetical protein
MMTEMVIIHLDKYLNDEGVVLDLIRIAIEIEKYPNQILLNVNKVVLNSEQLTKIDHV